MISIHLTLLPLLATVLGFSPNTRHLRTNAQNLHYQIFADSTKSTQTKPSWVPMELIELIAEEHHTSLKDFISHFVDGEAYTSCDDEGDELHECDFFGQYLGPTKWLHLTPSAHEAIDQIHFSIWKDVWKNPHSSVDVADRVAREVMSHYNKVIEHHNGSTISSKPLVRIKVIPASFGLEGFEDVIWEATEEILSYSLSNSSDRDNVPLDKDMTAITFVVASPDFSDPILSEHRCKHSSAQAEFACETFKPFVDTLQDKLTDFSRLEDVPLDDAITVKAFHPLWSQKFPYPCVAVSTRIVDKIAAP